jgi:hypothetical protein
VYRDFRSSLISVTDFFSIQITFLLKLSFPILSDHLFYGYLLEKHWNGSLLDTVETVLNFAKTLTFRGQNPVVKLIEKVYETGVKLTKAGMEEVEARIHRLPNLKKWFVEIFAKPL